MTETLGPAPAMQRRPLLVWVILVYYAFTVVWGLILECLMHFGLYSLSPREQVIFAGHLSTTARIFDDGVAILSLAGAIYLWSLRRVAVPLFSLVLVALICSSVKDVLVAQDPARVIFEVVNLVLVVLINGGILWYAVRLRRRGLLR